MNFKTLTVGNKEVPEFIFGSLTMAPLQRNLSVEEGGKIIAAAIEKGIRWIDTAQLYGSYAQIKRGIELSGINRDELVISSKSTHQTYEKMKAAIDEAFTALNTDYIDIFLLHSVRSADDFKERQGALDALIEAKKENKIGFIGISTHAMDCARAVAHDERLSWYHMIINYKGIGILDGTVEDQEAVMAEIKKRGAHIYAMKPLGGGYLKNDAEYAINWVRNHPSIDAVALGMTSLEELEMNVNVFQNKKTPVELVDKLKSIEKKLFIFTPLCNGCGSCEKTCDQNAITVVEGKAQVTPEKCMLCGYCVPSCPQFALRII